MSDNIPRYANGMAVNNISQGDKFRIINHAGVIYESVVEITAIKAAENGFAVDVFSGKAYRIIALPTCCLIPAGRFMIGDYVIDSGGDNGMVLGYIGIRCVVEINDSVKIINESDLKRVTSAPAIEKSLRDNRLLFLKESQHRAMKSIFDIGYRDDDEWVDNVIRDIDTFFKNKRIKVKQEFK